MPKVNLSSASSASNTPTAAKTSVVPSTSLPPPPTDLSAAPKKKSEEKHRPKINFTSELPQGDPNTEKLVIASNRLPLEGAQGGLISAVAPVMRDQREGYWVGWNGKIDPALDTEGATRDVDVTPFGKSQLLSFALGAEEHKGFYEQFSNGGIWPNFHHLMEHADLKAGSFDVYQKVNDVFAEVISSVAKSKDSVWVHDYQLAGVGKALRDIGRNLKTGWFNHIPFPSPDMLKNLPEHQELVNSLCQYDVVGMQIKNDVDNFVKYLQENGGEKVDDHHVQVDGKVVHAQKFPIGIDAHSFTTDISSQNAMELVRHVENEADHSRLQIVGAERLDYTKGLVLKMNAFDAFLAAHPEMHGKVTMIQISAPSRGTIPAYQKERNDMVDAVKDTNLKYGTKDWTPIILIEKNVAREAMPWFLRQGRINYVAPKKDGMNLVAKESVLYQDPVNPGVLLLSEGAGASKQLTGALIVDPHKPAETGESINTALHMSLGERRQRHQINLKSVQEDDVTHWQDTYLSVLLSHDCPPSKALPEQGKVLGEIHDDEDSGPFEHPVK